MPLLADTTRASRRAVLDFALADTPHAIIYRYDH